MWPKLCTALVLIVNLEGSAGEVFDWCKHDCREYGKPQAKHSLCVLPAGGGPGCSSYRPGLTKEEQQYILDMHNEVRAKVANGHEERGLGGKQPEAADMMELVWDDEVAMIAQRWADQCRTGGHDQCRQTMDGVPNGQNVAITRGTGMDPSRTSLIADMCNKWFDEVADMVTSDVDAVFRSSDPRKKIGHYTQAVWGRTTRIGCAMVHLRGGAFAAKLVCNYKMNGNYRDTPIYTRGKPASKCPSYSRPSTKYPGLCTVTGPEDFSIPTITMDATDFGQLPQSGDAFPTSIVGKPFFKSNPQFGSPQASSSAFEGPQTVSGDPSQALASFFKIPVAYKDGKPQIMELPISPNGKPQLVEIPISSAGKPQLVEIPVTSTSGDSNTQPNTVGVMPMTANSLSPGKVDMTGSNQAPFQPQETRKKPSLFWRIITLPWRFLKWLLSIPFRIFYFLKDKLFN